MTQNKKDPNDPNVEDINPEIVSLARHNGFIKQPFELWLHGDLTYRECLELIVILLGKEYKAQAKLLVATLQEHGPSATMLLAGASGPLIKALPSRPLENNG